MDHRPGDHIRSTLPRRRLTYPLHKIVAAVDRSETDRVAAALDDAGFAPDRVEVITAEQVDGLGEPVGGSGLHGVLVRLELSLGDDLDELEQVRRELASEYALIQVQVRGETEQVRAHAILRQHGGRAMHYFGRWTITPLDHR